MNPLQNISELFGLTDKNYSYDAVASEAINFAQGDFLSSQELIFGKAASGSVNLWAYQQMNIAPTLAASSTYE